MLNIKFKKNLMLKEKKKRIIERKFEIETIYLTLKCPKTSIIHFSNV